MWFRRCYTSSAGDTCRVWLFNVYLCPGHSLFWCKRRHIARRGGDISSRDARISTSGCPNLPRLNKLRCPKLRKDARIWVKMPESRLTIRGKYSRLNNSIVLFLMVNTIIYAVNPLHSDILNWMIIFKIFKLSWHVSYSGGIALFSQILWIIHMEFHQCQYVRYCDQIWLPITV